MSWESASYVCHCLSLNLNQNLTVNSVCPFIDGHDKIDVSFIRDVLRIDIFSGALKLEASKKGELLPDSVYNEEIPAAFIEGIENSKIAGHLAGEYLCHLAKARNKLALTRILKCVLESDSDLAYLDMFQHQFMFALANMVEDFKSDSKFRDFIFNSYLLVKVKKESVLRHTLRLLQLIKLKIGKELFSELIEKFKPPESCSGITDDLYKKLVA